ncbi:EAL domain-containing protein [Persephonella sp.]
MAKPESISRLTYWGALGLLTLAFLFFVAFNIYKEYKRYNLNAVQLKQTIINERKEVLAANLREIISLINFQEKQLEKYLKDRLKDEVTIVDSILAGVYSQLKNRLEKKQIEKILLNSVKDVRFASGRGYFFITTADEVGTVLENPAFPYIEGKSMWNFQDIFGKYVQKEFFKVVSQQGEGFVEYYWYLPGKDGIPFKKISFVKLFEPFNWIIGSGDYVEYLRQELKKNFARTVSMSTAVDSKVKVVVFDYMEQDKCISPEDVCRQFSFLKNHLREGFLKLNNILFYIHKCPTWKIYIVSAYPLADISEEINIPLSQMKSIMIKDIVFSTSVGLVFYMFMFAVTARFLRRIKEQEEEVKEKEYRLLKESRKLFTRFYTDPITHLPNRNKFSIDLEKAKTASVALFNIDRFREINDVFGYDFGDYVLKTVGNFIKKEAKAFNPKLKVYRISGDEFLLADFENRTSRSSFKSLVEKIVDRINTMIIKDKNNAVNINISAGIAIKETNPLRKADIALAQAKNNSEKPVVVYDGSKSTIDEYKENIIWVEKIRKALQEDRIVLYYQPVVNNKTGKIVRYEALVRLIDEDGKVYTPYYFLPVARQYKLYAEISREVVKKAVRTIKEKGVHLSINLSLSDILNIEMKNYILKTLRETGLGDKITLEILEDESIEGSQDVIEFISAVKMYGVQIAIDDFGRGYSNFSYLTQLHVDNIKIDGSLIKDINKDRTKRAVVEAIVTFAKEIGLKTTAEFVENEDILQIVKELGIDCSQGYYIGKPAPEILDIS